jgi:5'-nucleotidase
VRSRGLARGTFLHVNVPPGTLEQIRGFRVTRQSQLAGVERFEEQRSPDGRRYFWNIWQPPRRDVEGTDVWAVGQGYVAITPMRVGEYDADTAARWRDLRW